MPSATSGFVAFPTDLIVFRPAISGFRRGTDPLGSWSSSTGDSGGRVSTVH